jgi:hypothetical protein
LVRRARCADCGAAGCDTVTEPYPIATDMSALGPGWARIGWQQFATLSGDVLIRWNYDIGDSEVGTLRAMRDKGTVMTMQVRVAPGEFWLLARRCAVRVVGVRRRA